MRYPTIYSRVRNNRLKNIIFISYYYIYIFAELRATCQAPLSCELPITLALIKLSRLKKMQIVFR